MARILLMGSASGGSTTVASVPVVPAVLTVLSLKSSPDGGLWSINDATAIYDSSNSYAYIGYVSSTGAVQVATWNTATSAIVSTATLTTGLEIHAAPALLLRNDGYILVGWSAHDGTEIKLARSTNTHDASAFNVATSLTSVNLNTWPDITYIYLHQLSGESNKLHMFWREVHASANFGRLAHSTSTDGGATWALRDLIVIAQSSTEVVYWKSVSDATKIHIFHTDTSRSDANPSSLYHRYYDSADGLWHKSDGTTVSSTDPAASTLIQNAASGPVSPTGVGIEGDGTPFCAYVIIQSAASDAQYVARYRGAWQKNLVSNSDGLASGHRTLAGIAVNPTNPDRALTIRKNGTYFEPYLYTSADDGVNWTGAALTNGSSSSALAPQAVKGAPTKLEFVWARGTWVTDSNYTVGMEGYGA